MKAEADKYVVFDTGSSSPLGQVKLAGVLQQSSGVTSPRVFGLYALVYVTGGRGYFRDETGYSASLRPGDLLVIFPDISHVYGPIGRDPWSETFVVFEGSVVELWRQQGLLRPERPLYHLEPVDHWQGRVVAAAWTDPQPGAEFALARLCRVQQLLADVLTQQRRRERAEPRWLALATELLAAYVTTSPDYPDLAGKLGMTYEGFRKRFVREAHVSPGRYLAQLRMQKACELLVRDPMPLRRVALELGFFDEFHFSKQFKKAVGVTPKEFRRLFA